MVAVFEYGFSNLNENERASAPCTLANVLLKPNKFRTLKLNEIVVSHNIIRIFSRSLWAVTRPGQFSSVMSATLSHVGFVRACVGISCSLFLSSIDSVSGGLPDRFI